ncbi:MAG: CDP-alcohol phosphatidyltransferase family protein [Halobacteriota archaeon]
MTLERLRTVSDGLVVPLARLSARIGLGPHAVSVLGFAGAVGAAVGFAVGGPEGYLAGAGLVVVSGILDLVDGALARELEVASPAGDVLDHTLDRYADIALDGGLALGIDRPLLGFLAVTGVLMTSYLGTQAQAVGIDRMYAGVLGRADRLMLVGVVAVLAWGVGATVAGVPLVAAVLVFLAVIGHLTAVQRLSSALGQLP